MEKTVPFVILPKNLVITKYSLDFRSDLISDSPCTLGSTPQGFSKVFGNAACLLRRSATARTELLTLWVLRFRNTTNNNRQRLIEVGLTKAVEPLPSRIHESYQILCLTFRVLLNSSVTNPSFTFLIILGQNCFWYWLPANYLHTWLLSEWMLLKKLYSVF